MSQFLERFSNNLKKNVPGFIAVAITEVKTGIVFYSLSADPDYDPELASSFYLEIIKTNLNSIYILKLKNQKIDTIVVNLTTQFHLIDLAENGEFFIYLALEDDGNGNLETAKSLLKQYKQEVKQIRDDLQIIQEDLKKDEEKKAQIIRDELLLIEEELKKVRKDLDLD